MVQPNRRDAPLAARPRKTKSSWLSPHSAKKIEPRRNRRQKLTRILLLGGRQERPQDAAHVGGTARKTWTSAPAAKIPQDRTPTRQIISLLPSHYRYFRREAISLFPSILVSGAAFLNDAASRKKLPDAGRPAKIVPKRARRRGCRPAALTQLCRVLWRFARSRDLFAGWRPAQRNRSKRRCTISRSSSIAASEASALSASFRVLPFCRTLKTFDLDHDAIMRRSRYLNA